MAAAQFPPIEYLRKRLRYEPETGKLFWRVAGREEFVSQRSWTVWNKRYSGKEVGRVSARGYLVVVLRGKSLASHRVAWAIHTGAWPQNQIDHINGLRTDNRFENMRDVTHAENSRNMRMLDRNSSGRVGVFWAAQSKRWNAQIGHNGRRIHLGSFKEFTDAVAAREAGEVEYGYHPNHGRVVVRQIRREMGLPKSEALR